MRGALLDWYDANKRDLPWRRTRDPYAVWVSEIMLQQTRVETVVPYYERFLARFPTAAALAAASEDEVLASWSGLGYYRRARLLHAGVREVVERYGGEVPRDAEARRSLPGVGRYTAGAIGSICFDREEPVVDGNVARVLSRAFAIEHPLGTSASERALWEHAGALVRGPRPGDLNQALMELGARVCTPLSPRCGECPIARECAARAQGRTAELPVPKPRKPPVRVEVAAVVATRADGSVALVRSERALFGGLYAPPMAEGRGRAAALAALRGAGVRARVEASSAARLEHVLSHRVIDVEVWRATGASSRTCRLVTPRELASVGVSTFARRILRAALGE
ncbi:MAG TPA: A/G-specific adenine glycosylase [Sandaracinaceae bacterium]